MIDAASEYDTTELVRELETLREQQEAIRAVLRALASSANLQAVMDEVVEACTRLCNADAGALWLLEGELLHYLAHYGHAPNLTYDRDHPHALDRRTAAGRTAVTRQPLHIPDVELDPEYAYTGPVHYRSMLGVPILMEDELIGVVVVVRFETAPFSDEHMALAQTFADQAAVAIANARLLETVERQRTELARFLSPQVAELISSKEGKQLLAGHRAYLTIAYFDLRGFTAFAETAEPEELIDIVREYHAVAGELVNEHDGTLEHFAGDGLMVFFNDPVQVDEPELQAAKLALAMRERIGECAERWAQARLRPRPRQRDCRRARDSRPDRVRGQVRLRGARDRDERRGPAERRGGCGADPHQPACVRGARRPSGREAGGRAPAEGSRPPDGGLRARRLVELSQRHSTAASSTGSANPLSVSERGSESRNRLAPSRVPVLKRISPPPASAPMRAAMWTPWPV
jgi:class 3 adenylate cyclase